MDSEEEAFMSFQVRSDKAEWADSDGASISPRRSDPKKAVVAAAHMTCLVSGSQDVFAIFEPSVISKGKVTTLLMFWDGELRASFDAPFSSWLSVKSWVIYSHEKPLSPCTNFIADMYERIVDGASFLTWWHQTTNARHAVTGIGQVLVFLVSASKHENVFKADEYFVQVDFAIDEFMRL